MNRYRIHILVAATLSATLWAYACGDGATEPPTAPPDPPRPTTVTVTPATTHLSALGATVQLSAEVRDQNGQVISGAAVAWTSSNAQVASVNATGLVTAVGNGMATITAAAGQARGTAKITVGDPDRAALVAVYEATDGPNWVNNEGWLTDEPIEDWFGVDTDGFGRVLALNLGGQWDSERREWIPHGLQGSVPAEIGSLTNLGYLSLNHNALTGPIPAELGNLSNLEYLRLGYNALTGPIPAELGSLSALGYLFLGRNELTGPVPPELGNLSNLESLVLRDNALTGPIPTELGSLTALRNLTLGGNELTGPIPTELGNLSSLESLRLYSNELTGPVPTELGNLSNLEWLSLNNNALTGPIPTELGNLSNLESLVLRDNALTGPLPRSLLQLVNLTRLHFRGNDGLCAPGTAEFAAWIEGIERSEAPFCNEADREALERLFETAGGTGWTKSDGWRATPALGEWHGVTADFLGRVEALDLSGNGLAGKVPKWGRGALAHMTELRIGGNANLVGRLPLSLTGSPLRVLHYAGTGLCAPADAAFARWLSSISSYQGTGAECAPLSDREILEILYEAIDGPNWTNNDNSLTAAPLSEWHGVQLNDGGRVVGLSLFANRLRGTIPPELGQLTELRNLRLARNYSGLTGAIPAELGNLPNLETLNLYSNALDGAIPVELGNLANLRRLNLDRNALEGAIPPALGNLASLYNLSLNDNDLEGAIPPELGSLANLQNLFLAGNGLTGSIPSTLSNLASLRWLSLGRNGLTGPLPAELGGLSQLQGLYVGHNDLTGPVPQEFGRLTRLRELAFSGNIDMSGALPSSLTNLRSLETLEASGTQLCAPSDPRFLEWLDQLPSRRVALCGGEPASAYLVQPVQSRAFPVPLVAGEEALLRVFVTAAQDNEERLPPVRASFHLDGALVHVADIPGKPGPIPTDVDEGSLAASANRVIPAEVVRPGLEMVIEIDPDGTLDLGLGVAKRIPATGRIPVDVREMPVFDLTVVPFLWSTEPDSSILEQTAGMAGDPEGHELLEHTRILLPVGELDVKAHERVLSSSNDAYAILRETRAIRVMEDGSGYYMGMMSSPATGAAGLGGAGGVSFAVPRSSVIAHEFGHNMSLSHAPCGGAAGPDPAFPYRGGATGAWGYDFRDGGNLVPPTMSDLMSYCRPRDGISDYHFTKALNFRLDHEGVAGAALANHPSNAETEAVVPPRGRTAVSESHPQVVGTLDHRSTTQYALRTVSGQPSVTERRGAVVAVVPAVFGPFPDVAQNIEQTPGVGLERPRRCGIRVSVGALGMRLTERKTSATGYSLVTAVGVAALIDTQIQIRSNQGSHAPGGNTFHLRVQDAAPPESRRARSRPSDPLPLRLTQQPVLLSRLPGKPLNVGLSVLPTHIDDRPASASPSFVPGHPSVATTDRNALVPFRKSDLVDSDGERRPDPYPMLRPLVGPAASLRFGGPHHEPTVRYHNEQRAHSTVPKYQSRAEPLHFRQPRLRLDEQLQRRLIVFAVPACRLQVSAR